MTDLIRGTERLVLRLVLSDDVPDVYDILGDLSADRLLLYPHPCHAIFLPVTGKRFHMGIGGHRQA